MAKIGGFFGWKAIMEIDEPSARNAISIEKHNKTFSEKFDENQIEKEYKQYLRNK